MNQKWDPIQYAKFEKERQQPFFDLMDLIKPYPDMRLLDIGCGDGNLTKILHERLKAAHTLGIDSSANMLEKSGANAGANMELRLMDIWTFKSEEPFDLVFSNAALQWVPDHFALLAHLKNLLSPNGQLAIQMPSNKDYATHAIALQLAQETPYKETLQSAYNPFKHILSLEDYARLLYTLGFKAPLVRLQVYPHLLNSTACVLEWVKGSLLTYYQTYLGPDLYEKFLQAYQERLFAHLGMQKPFLFTIKRLFIWGQLNL